MIANPAFQVECNGALIHQFANSLRDDIIRPLAKDLINRKPGDSIYQIPLRGREPQRVLFKKDTHKGHRKHGRGRRGDR